MVNASLHFLNTVCSSGECVCQHSLFYRKIEAKAWMHFKLVIIIKQKTNHTVYKSRFVYCREFAPDKVSLTDDRVRSDDSKQYDIYRVRRGKTHPLRNFSNRNFNWKIYTFCVVLISFYKKMTIKSPTDAMYGSNNSNFFYI